jgi:hypothetical protein
MSSGCCTRIVADGGPSIQECTAAVGWGKVDNTGRRALRWINDMSSDPTTPELPAAPVVPPPVVPPTQAFVPQALPAATLDDRGCIAQDLVCRSCGYALRGLPMSGACPECGTPVGKSIYGDLLQFSDPKWVERIALGVNILAIAFIVSIAGGVLVGAVTIGIAVAVGGNPIVFIIPLMLFMLLVGAANVIGYWLATTRDPGTDESANPFTARAIARWAIVISSVAGLAAVPLDRSISAMTGAAFIGNPTLHMALSIVGIVASQGLGAVGLVALLVYAGQLARRLPDERLARNTRIVTWGYGLCSAVMIAGTVVATLAESAPGGAGGMAGGNPSTLAIIGGVAMAVGGIPVMVFGIWALVLLFMFRSRLRKAAEQARLSWAR